MGREGARGEVGGRSVGRSTRARVDDDRVSITCRFHIVARAFVRAFVRSCDASCPRRTARARDA